MIYIRERAYNVTRIELLFDKIALVGTTITIDGRVGKNKEGKKGEGEAKKKGENAKNAARNAGMRPGIVVARACIYL